MVQPVVPGDSFDIKAAFGLKFSPLVFPVQSHMRAHMHFFYVRNKNIWENWQNYIQQLEEHEHPYIEQPSSFFKTGSLSDYLGVPTTQTGSKNVSYVVNTPPLDLFDVVEVGRRGRFGRYVDLTNITDIVTQEITDIGTVNNVPLPFLNLDTEDADGYQWNDLVFTRGNGNFVFYPSKLPGVIDPDYNIQFYVNLTAPGQFNVRLTLWINQPGQPFASEGTYNYNNSHYYCDGHLSNNAYSQNDVYCPFKFVSENPDDWSHFCNQVEACINAGYDCYLGLLIQPGIDEDFSANTLNTSGVYTDDKSTTYPVLFQNRFIYTGLVGDVNDRGLKPFGSEVSAASGQRIKINALPYRAYESIYHCFYRNQHGNQPFYIDGVEQFNRYNTTLADGADTTPYHLFYRNYELDYLTSALQSPQQGVAPMVGVSALGNVTIADENGITTAKAEVDNDGTITNVVLTSPAASTDHARVALSLATSGFSINDFRGTNALQKWLEMNLRRGYKYIDFVKGHFGQEPHYDSLNMPEFIGGFSQDVQVNMISSTADTAGTGGLLLGDYVGQANCFGGSGHQIRKYCDDYGYIIGILCVVPTPAYTQMLPKYFLHHEPLDYYFPEFRNLGLMPITYREVCPNQSYSEYLATEGSSGNNTDTFGYQRPNYDMVGQVDEVHGEFRSTMKDYLVNRIFEDRPELGTDFLTINPSEVNNIFSIQSPEEDTIFGQIVLDVKAKRPVPRVVVPNLG